MFEWLFKIILFGVDVLEQLPSLDISLNPVVYGLMVIVIIIPMFSRRIYRHIF